MEIESIRENDEQVFGIVENAFNNELIIFDHLRQN